MAGASSTIEAKLEKLSKSIENKYREIDDLRAKHKTLNDETIQLKEARPHPLILPELNKNLADLEYALGIYTTSI